MKIDSTTGLTIELNMAGPPSPPAIAPPPPRPALPLHQRPINLIRGWPSPDILPVALLRSAALRVFADPDISTPALQYGPDPGYEPLREGLAAWLGRHFAVAPDPKRICITGGASQSLACVLQSYADPAYTRAVWMIAPCYHLACPMFEEGGFAGRLRVAREDDEGIDLEALEEGIKRLDREQEGLPQREPFKGTRPSRKYYRHLIYVVTTSANPSGKSMSLRRRSGLVELARKYDALVISDDVYDFLQWRLDQEDDTDLDELVLPRLCDIDLAMGPSSNDPDGFGHAISNGSFSKIAGPGCRTGWVEASPAFVHGLGLTGSSRSGGAPSQFCAAMLSQIVQTGELEAHINTKTRPTLKHRHRLIMGAVREHITSVEGIQVREASLLGGRTYGGYFVWIKLPEGFSASTVAQVARAEEKLIVAPGGMFEIAGDEDSARFDDHVRLCFAWEPEEALVEGTARLGRVLRRIKEKTTYYHQAFPTISGLEFLQAHK